MQWELFLSPGWLSQESRSCLPVSAPLFPTALPKCWQNCSLPARRYYGVLSCLPHPSGSTTLSCSSLEITLLFVQPLTQKRLKYMTNGIVHHEGSRIDQSAKSPGVLQLCGVTGSEAHHDLIPNHPSFARQKKGRDAIFGKSCPLLLLCLSHY